MQRCDHVVSRPNQYTSALNLYPWLRVHLEKGRGEWYRMAIRAWGVGNHLWACVPKNDIEVMVMMSHQQSYQNETEQDGAQRTCWHGRGKSSCPSSRQKYIGSSRILRMGEMVFHSQKPTTCYPTLSGQCWNPIRQMTLYRLSSLYSYILFYIYIKWMYILWYISQQLKRYMSLLENNMEI